MTEKEMQYIADAVAGFYNVAAREKLNISADRTSLLLTTLQKWKQVIALNDLSLPS